MAETANGRKEVYVRGYTKPDGTKVGPHYRSTPKTSTGAKPAPKKVSQRGRGR